MFNENGQPPGRYLVDVYLNEKLVDSREIDFSVQKDQHGHSRLLPCLSLEQLAGYGIKVEDFSVLTTDGKCAHIDGIPAAESHFNLPMQQLTLSIPQVALRAPLRGIAPQALWNDGLPALLMNYSANFSRSELRGSSTQTNDTAWVNVQPGANIGAWRLRNSSTWDNFDTNSGLQTLWTYAERGFYDQKVRLTLGEKTTSGDVFDSVPFRGVMLSSDENMVPFNQSSFAPVIRGIARTQARVEIMQGGYSVYSDTVAPGPFAISDFTPVGSGSDLQVTVTEADGQKQFFTVPWQTPAIALHEGYFKYNLMMGKYRSSYHSVDSSTVGQVSAIYGLPYGMTVYSGLQQAENYRSGAAGMGTSLGRLGSVSLDTTTSRAQKKGKQRENGESWRLRYSNNIYGSNSTLTFNQQYASERYSSLSDALDTWRPDNYSSTSLNRGLRNRKTVTLSQPLGNAGALSLSATRLSYHNRSVHTNLMSGNYGINLNGIYTSLNLARNNRAQTDGSVVMDNVVSIWISIPLERWMGSSTRMSLQTISSSSGGSNQQVGLNGTAADNRLHWNVSQRRNSGNNHTTNSSALQAKWYGGYGQVGANYTYSPEWRQMSGDLEGGIVVHRGGVTFGQPLSDTVALVETPNASGVPVGYGMGVRTDFMGYTTVANMRPYQENVISIDPSVLPDDVDVSQTDIRVIPTAGAIIPVKFNTRSGKKILFNLKHKHAAIPFGAIATIKGESGQTGLVGDAGSVYLTGMPDKGGISVNWKGNQCTATYNLNVEKNKDLYVVDANCH